MTRLILLTGILISLASNSFCQDKKIKILLLGTEHNFQANLNQNFKEVIAKLYSFKPDLICMESLPVTDTGILHKYYTANFEKSLLMKKQYNLSEKQVIDSVNYYYKKLNKKGDELEYHISLARNLYMCYNYANATYHWWIANFIAQQKQIAITDTPTAKYPEKSKYNEYYNVVYPLAHKLNIKKLFQADDQTFYPKDLLAQQKTQEQLISSPDGAAAMAIYKSLTEDRDKYMKEGRLFDTILNDSTYQDKYSDLIVNTYPKWSKSEWAKEMSEIWKERNKLIVQNIIKAIEQNPKAKKILVTFGAAHIPMLKFYLRQHSNIEIISYQSLQ